MSKTELKLVLRDPQSILRKSVGDGVIVVKHSAANLLSTGENFSSTLFKVDTVIKRTKDSPEENLALVAKMMPTGEFQRAHFNSTAAFKKEMFVYEKLMPALRDLEKGIGLKDEEFFNMTPKYYGGRLSMNKDKTDVADEDAVMLLENLKELGYYTMDKKTGMDLDHAKLAIRGLARFHALSIALRQKKSDFFKEVEKSLNLPNEETPFGMEEKEFEAVMNRFLDATCEDTRIAKYKDRIKASVEASKNSEIIAGDKSEESWIALSHNDFWVNNVLFRQENGQIKDTKFIDFQLITTGSPLKDLPHFLLTSVRIDVTEHYLDELLDTYHSNLIQVLSRNGCDISPFTRENFHKQLRKDANPRLLHYLVVAKFITQELDDVDLNDMIKIILTSKPSDLYFERAWMMVRKYVEKGWI